MDAGAFASLVYLAEILEIVKRRSIDGLPPRLDEQQIDDFRGKVISLQKFLEKLPPGAWPGFEDGIRKVVDVVFAAKNTIDAHVVDQTMGVRDQEMDGGLSAFRDDLSSVMEEMEMVTRELEAAAISSDSLLSVEGEMAPTKHQVVREVYETADESSDPPPASEKITHPIQAGVVGFEQRIDQLKLQLAGHDKPLKVIAIVGKGGIGKTTLARCLYEDPSSVNHFHRRIWCTVSQVWSVVSLLQVLVDDTDTDNIPVLGEKLHHKLFRLRYLVVVDDVWSIDVWEKLKIYFPDDNNKSRIIVTTREEKIACALSSSHPFKMDILDSNQSWELLRKKVFGHGTNCPSYLEDIGKDIANSCMGFPLSIVAVAGLLSKSNRTPDYWSYVARNVFTDGQCLKILSFSYENMPLHLKPCFIYLRRYKDDKIIRADSLMEDWICSGIVKPIYGKTMYETTRKYLKDLIDRNLVLVEEMDDVLNDPIICRIHDLTLDLCGEILKGCPQKIIINPSGYCWHGTMYSHCLHVSIDAFWMGRKANGCHGSIIHQVRRLDIHDVDDKCPRCKGQWQLVTCSKSQPTYSPLICNSDSTVSHFYVNNHAILSEDLMYKVHGPKALCLPLCLFWNLLFLSERDINRPTCQSKIWDMPQLQTCSTDGELVPMILEKPVILEKLWKLESRIMKCTKEMIEGIPNLKSLHVTYDYDKDLSGHCLENMECWGQLQELCITRVHLDSTNIRYPKALVVLKFEFCSLYLTHTILRASMLPSLKRLVLHYCDLGYEWNMKGVVFEKLEYLQITNSNRRYPQRWRWRGGESNFPELKILAVEEDYLEKIPLDMGNIVTLQLIIARKCCDRVLESAKLIIRIHRRESGNETLELHIYEGSSDSTYSVFNEDDFQEEEQEEEDDDDEEEEELCIFGDKLVNSSITASCKVLRLVESPLQWSHTELIGGTSLPNLKRLILKKCIMENHHWRMGDVEFQGLQYLQIIDHDFGTGVRGWEWSAKASNFPKLETVEIINGYHLERIPLDLGNIATLVCIRVACCSHEVVESAKRIFMRKDSDTFQLLIGSFNSVSGVVEDKVFHYKKGNEEDGPLDFPQLVQQFNSRKELLDHLFDRWILTDDGRKSFSVDRATGKKCFMLSARELIIEHGDNPKYWAWESNTKSRFLEVARLLAVYWLDVIGMIQLNMLSPSTTYAAYLVFSLDNYVEDLDIHTMEGQVNINNEKHETRLVYLLNPRECRHLKHTEKPSLRDDGWMEVKLGQGFVNGGEVGTFAARLIENKVLERKRGVIIEGIEIRPTSISITLV